jgi:RNA polymerase sigma factor (TIGR02999 family)
MKNRARRLTTRPHASSLLLPIRSVIVRFMSDTGANPHPIGAGNPRAAQQLLPLVYDELRRLAAAQLAHEPEGHSLNGTALVHEAFMRLGGDQSFSSKSAFLRAAAEAMRRILVDHARAKRAEKRGGNLVRIELPDVPAALPDDDVLALDGALARFAVLDAQAAELVQLRYFSGLTIPQAAEALEIAPRTADRIWSFARAWLHRELSGQNWRDSGTDSA